MEIEQVKQLLLDSEEEKAAEIISKVPNISNDLFDFLLTLKDKTAATSSLMAVNTFSAKQLARLGTYIEENLAHEDDIFVSELIDLAAIWNIDSLWPHCMGLVVNEDAPVAVRMSAIEFLWYSLRVERIPQFVEVLKKAIEQSEFYQPYITLAVFYAFRVGHNSEHLRLLKELLLIDPTHAEILSNLLQDSENLAASFAPYAEMRRWLKMSDEEISAELHAD